MKHDFLRCFSGKFPGANIRKGSPVFLGGIFQSNGNLGPISSKLSLIPVSDLRGLFFQ